MTGQLIVERDFRESLLQQVDPTEGGWFLHCGDGWGLFCPSTNCDQPPQPGETVKVIPGIVGARVRGIVIAERVYFYHTEAEDRRAQEQEKEARNAERQQKLDATREDRDQRIAQLHPQLAARLQRFHRVLPHWRRDFEDYELFVCEEAMKIATAVRARYESQEARALDLLAGQSAVREFYDSQPWQESAGISPEHSGNTFGAACQFALLLLTQTDRLVRAHGALCALVGCESYGCFAAYPEA